MRMNSSFRLACVAGTALFALTATAARAQQCVAPPADMSFWYAADGTDAERIGSLPATRHGSVSDAAGRFDQGVLIPHAGWISFADAPALDMGVRDFTIDAWVRTGDDGTVPVVDKRHAPNPRNTTGYFLFIMNGRLGLQLGDGLFRNVISNGPLINDDRWHHVTATIDRGRRQVTLWVDGVQVTTSSHMPPPGASIDNDERLMIGRGYVGAALNEGGSVAVDEVEIIRRVLQPSEIQALARRPKCKEPEAFDVAVSKTGPDRSGRFTIAIRNQGRALPAGAVIRLREVLPAGLTLATLPGAPWQCDGTAPVQGPDAVTCTMVAPAAIPTGTTLPPIVLQGRGGEGCPNCVRIDVFENRRAFEARFPLPETETRNNVSCARAPARP